MDKISVERCKTLQPIVRDKVLKILAKYPQIRVAQALRTIEQQNAISTKNTKAKGSQSAHVYGLAVDICILIDDGKSVDFNVQNYPYIIKEFKAEGFDWGGEWKGFKDYPHFQLPILSYNELGKNTFEINENLVKERLI